MLDNKLMGEATLGTVQQLITAQPLILENPVSLCILLHAACQPEMQRSMQLRLQPAVLYEIKVRTALDSDLHTHSKPRTPEPVHASVFIHGEGGHSGPLPLLGSKQTQPFLPGQVSSKSCFN